MVYAGDPTTLETHISGVSYFSGGVIEKLFFHIYLFHCKELTYPDTFFFNKDNHNKYDYKLITERQPSLLKHL